MNEIAIKRHSFDLAKKSFEGVFRKQRLNSKSIKFEQMVDFWSW